AAGFQHRRSFLRLSQGRLRRALRRGRGAAEDDVDRHALPPAWPARAVQSAAALPRPHREARQGMGVPAGGHCAALDRSEERRGGKGGGGGWWGETETE